MSDWWPGGPRGAQGATRAGHFPQDTWRGQALGCWVYHFGHLDYEETDTPHPQVGGATAQKVSAYSSVLWAVGTECP